MRRDALPHVRHDPLTREVNDDLRAPTSVWAEDLQGASAALSITARWTPRADDLRCTGNEYFMLDEPRVDLPAGRAAPRCGGVGRVGRPRGRRRFRGARARCALRVAARWRAALANRPVRKSPGRPATCSLAHPKRASRHSPRTVRHASHSPDAEAGGPASCACGGALGSGGSATACQVSRAAVCVGVWRANVSIATNKGDQHPRSRRRR